MRQQKNCESKLRAFSAQPEPTALPYDVHKFVKLLRFVYLLFITNKASCTQQRDRKYSYNCEISNGV